jgi:hypothetical protein
LVDVDAIAADITYREQERSAAQRMALCRRELLADHGPTFFRDLVGEVQRGCKELARRNPKCAAVCDPPGDRNFRVRNPDIRPSVEVNVHLSTVNLLIRVQERQSGADPFTVQRQHRVDFSIDDNDRLALCMECLPVNIDDVAELILRAVFGLPKRS